MSNWNVDTHRTGAQSMLSPWPTVAEVSVERLHKAGLAKLLAALRRPCWKVRSGNES